MTAVFVAQYSVTYTARYGIGFVLKLMLHTGRSSGYTHDRHVNSEKTPKYVICRTVRIQHLTVTIVRSLIRT